MNLPELGVGLNWFPELDPVLKANKDLVNVLEVEPQSLWRRDKGSHSLVLDPASVEAPRQYQLPTLVHSVALPVGGTLAPPEVEPALFSAPAPRRPSPG